MPPGLAPEVIEFFAGDGMKLNLIHYPPAGDAPLADQTCALILGERR